MPALSAGRKRRKETEAAAAKGPGEAMETGTTLSNDEHLAELCKRLGVKDDLKTQAVDLLKKRLTDSNGRLNVSALADSEVQKALLALVVDPVTVTKSFAEAEQTKDRGKWSPHTAELFEYFDTLASQQQKSI